MIQALLVGFGLVAGGFMLGWAWRGLEVVAHELLMREATHRLLDMGLSGELVKFILLGDIPKKDEPTERAN